MRISHPIRSPSSRLVDWRTHAHARRGARTHAHTHARTCTPRRTHAHTHARMHAEAHMHMHTWYMKTRSTLRLKVLGSTESTKGSAHSRRGWRAAGVFPGDAAGVVRRDFAQESPHRRSRGAQSHAADTRSGPLSRPTHSDRRASVHAIVKARTFPKEAPLRRPAVGILPPV